MNAYPMPKWSLDEVLRDLPQTPEDFADADRQERLGAYAKELAEKDEVHELLSELADAAYELIPLLPNTFYMTTLKQRLLAIVKVAEGDQ